MRPCYRPRANEASLKFENEKIFFGKPRVVHAVREFVGACVIVEQYRQAQGCDSRKNEWLADGAFALPGGGVSVK
jgi:hypothetical protein